MHTLATNVRVTLGMGIKMHCTSGCHFLIPCFSFSIFRIRKKKKKNICALLLFYSIDVTAQVEQMNKESETVSIFFNERFHRVYLLKFK